MNEPKPEITDEPEVAVEHLSRDQVEQKLNELSRFRSKLVMDYQFVNFVHELEKKYGAQFVRRSELFHFVSGSNLRPGYAEKETFFDFAGEDSIEKYLRDNFPEK